MLGMAAAALLQPEPATSFRWLTITPYDSATGGVRDTDIPASNEVQQRGRILLDKSARLCAVRRVVVITRSALIVLQSASVKLQDQRQDDSTIRRFPQWQVRKAFFVVAYFLFVALFSSVSCGQTPTYQQNVTTTANWTTSSASTLPDGAIIYNRRPDHAVLFESGGNRSGENREPRLLP